MSETNNSNEVVVSIKNLQKPLAITWSCAISIWMCTRARSS